MPCQKLTVAQGLCRCIEILHWKCLGKVNGDSEIGFESIWSEQVSCTAQGKNLVLGGLKAMNGQLEFFGVDDMEPYRAAEHFMCTNIEWDPTGRYVATSVTSIHQMENGFNLWLFNGTPLYRRACLIAALPCHDSSWAQGASLRKMYTLQSRIVGRNEKGIKDRVQAAALCAVEASIATSQHFNGF